MAATLGPGGTIMGDHRWHDSSRQRKMLKKAEKQSIVSKIKSLTSETIATVSDVASCNRRVVGGIQFFGVKSVMVAGGETNLDVGARSSVVAQRL